MITREEQKSLFESLIGDLVINTMPDGTGSNVTIPVSVYWGSEPTELVLPAITCRFTTINQPIEKSLGNYWGSNSQGEITGFIGSNSLLIKIRGDNWGSYDENNFISMLDIVEALYNRCLEAALFKWDSLIADGSVEEDGISSANDVSEIMGYEQIKELQFYVRIKKLTGGVPVDGVVKYSTAPTLLEVKTNVYLNDIPN